MEDEYQKKLEKPLIDFYRNVRKNIDMERIYYELKKIQDNENKIKSKKRSIYIN
jgi:hypothetical protein